MKGTVKRLLRDRGYGFIRGEDGKEYFFHLSDLRGVTWDDLQEGEPVEFLQQDSRGNKARSVKRVGAPVEHRDEGERLPRGTGGSPLDELRAVYPRIELWGEWGKRLATSEPQRAALQKELGRLRLALIRAEAVLQEVAIGESPEAAEEPPQPEPEPL